MTHACRNPSAPTALFAATIGLAALLPAPAESASLQARIRKYECGDNCYLTLVDTAGREHTGLCTARECARWNQAAAMPPPLRGKRVVVTLGRGVQHDGSGNVMGRMQAFTAIRFID